jgi:DNA-directed RNA polymerase specialized sigma24 family protein
MNRDQLDSYLLQLATHAQRHPPYSKERQLVLTKLIHAIVCFGNLWQPQKNQFLGINRDIYIEASQEMFLFICENIDKYEPKRGTVMAWVNVLLERRFFRDALRKNQFQYTEKKMTLVDLDNLAAPENSEPLLEIIRESIEADIEDIFKNESMDKYPKLNFQKLALLRISGKSWKEISTEFQIKIPTVSSFYYRCLKKFSSKLKEYCSSHIN